MNRRLIEVSGWIVAVAVVSYRLGHEIGIRRSMRAMAGRPATVRSKIQAWHNRKAEEQRPRPRIMSTDEVAEMLRSRRNDQGAKIKDQGIEDDGIGSPGQTGQYL